MVRGKGFEPSNPYGTGSSSYSANETLYSFRKYLEVDRQLNEKTIGLHLSNVKRLLQVLGKSPTEITVEELREYLSKFKDANPYTYANVLKAMRVFFGGFIKTDISNGFRFPNYPFKPIMVPSKEELQKFYCAMEKARDKALFLIYATTGLRRNEVLSLKLEDMNLERRMIVPQKGNMGTTKNTWVSFFNEETKSVLAQYIQETDLDGSELFPSKSEVKRIFERAEKKTGIRITPQMLREWFCSEMLSKGVQEVYVDAFCGRVPRSVLARHYTDFSPDRLKEIYNKAGLKVLS
jgi:integrase/recombinase XerD